MIEEKEALTRAFLDAKGKEIREKVLENYCREQNADGYRVNRETIMSIDDESYFEKLYMFMMRKFHSQSEDGKTLLLIHYADLAKKLGKRNVSICDHDIVKQNAGRQFIMDLSDFSVEIVKRSVGRHRMGKPKVAPLPDYMTRGVKILRRIYNIERIKMERSYIMFKPGFVKREIIEDVFDRIQEIGGKITKMRLLQLSDECLKDHYPHLVNLFNEKNESIFEIVADYMKSAPVLGCIVEGKSGIVAKIREITGPTRNAPKGTIRGDYALDGTRNVIHASDPSENPEGEIERFFKRAEGLGVQVLDEFDGKDIAVFTAIKSMEKGK